MDQFVNIFFVMYMLMGIAVLQFMGINNILFAASLAIGLMKKRPTDTSKMEKNIIVSFYIILIILLWPIVLYEYYVNY